MHETGIAVSILEAAVRLIGSGSLEKVRVGVGELSAVEPRLLEFAWEAVVSDTPHTASTLEIDWRPARQHCPQCREDKTRREGSWLVVCPDCGHPLDVEGGYDLDLLQVTYTDETEATSGGAE